MDSQLTEFATTTAIGSAAVLSIWFLLSLIRGGWLGWMNLLSEGDWMRKAFILLSVVAIGMLAEDLSNKYVDTDDLPVELPLFPTEEYLRVDALFGLGSKVDSLAIEMAKNRAFSLHSGAEGELLDTVLLDSTLRSDLSWVCERVAHTVTKRATSPSCVFSQQKLEDLASRLYYSAKSTVYRVDQYYDELKSIQKRIDFSRSMALISLTIMTVSVVVVAVKLTAWLVLSMMDALITRFLTRHRNAQMFHRVQRGIRSIEIFWTWRALGIGMPIFLLSYASGVLAYAAEEREFDRRAFGYYSNLLESSEINMRSPVARPMTGLSAAIHVSEGSSYLLVADTKVSREQDVKAGDFERVSLLRFAPDGRPISTQIAADWSRSGIPDDLEAACSLDSKTGRFLVFESGSTRENLVKVKPKVIEMQLETHGDAARVVATRTWERETYPGEIEGALCLSEDVVILGVRKFSQRGQVVLLKMHLSDPSKYVVMQSMPIAHAMPFGHYNRAVSDLYLDSRQQLWAVATRDHEDRGPFASLVYRLGEVNAAGEMKLRLRPDAFVPIAALKVEALAPMNQNVLVASDDEVFGSTVRSLQLPDLAQ